MMENEFALLNQFLKEMGPEVEGHGSAPVTEEQVELIKKFASGGLTEDEREALLPALIENEKALLNLVDVIKSRQS